MCEGGWMMNNEWYCTHSRYVGFDGSVQVSSQLFLRGNIIVLYHLLSKGSCD